QRRTGQSLSQILANHSAVINSFDQETLDQLSPNRLSTSPGLTGLRNLGNSCYANCVLQCLSNTVLLATHFSSSAAGTTCQRELRCIVEIRRLRRRLGRRRQQKGTPAEHRRELLEALPGAVVRRVRQREPRRHPDGCGSLRRPVPLSKAVRSSRIAQEFLLFLLDGMHEDLNRRSTGKAFESSLASLEVNSVESTAPGQQQHQEDLEASLAW
uniref:ubiquitinyl hydrolase 1 n=1 Tax=Macrostomum lignano TaxID=282301 RepID=A0A1I8IE36_9PLAT